MTPGFLKLLLSELVYVCPSLRALITIHTNSTRNYWLNQFYSFSIFYMKLAVNKLNGHGLSTHHCEGLAKKTKVGTLLGIEEGILTSNKMEHFSYKGEWVNA